MINFEGMPENFKGTYPSAQCIIDCTEHFCQGSSFLTVHCKVPLIQAKSAMLPNVVT